MISRRLLRYSSTLCVRSRPFIASPPSRNHLHSSRIPQLSTRITSRSYSTKEENDNDNKGDTPPPEEPNPNPTEEDPKTKEIEAQKKEIIELKDKFLRSVADFRNLQDRTKRDIDAARSFAITRFAADLMESVDNLDRALNTVSPEKVGQADSNKELSNLYEGLKMTDTILLQTLKKHGLERFDPSVEGEMFNPNMHEATFQTKVEGREEGSVFMTQQKGFLLNGRVVRAAKVGVVKNS
ncbi:GrpE, mitochondrial [Lecanora helva]